MRRSSTSCPRVIDDVDHVERFTVLAVAPDVLQRLRDRPVRAHRDEVRRHQPADAVLGVAQQPAGDTALLGGEQGEHLLGDRGGQLLEQVGAVIRRHVVEDRGDLVPGQRLEQALLGLGLEVLEHLGGLVTPQNAEGDRLILVLQRLDGVRRVRRLEVGEQLAKLEEPPFLQRQLDLFVELFGQHATYPPAAARSSAR